MKENRNLSSPKKGMNRDAAPYNLQENEYSFALNTIFESESGDTYNPKNESSNILSAKFPKGYKVVGLKKDIKADRTIYWITNPETGLSQIGFIKNGGEYQILIEDSKDDLLGFDITHPIKKIELKYEKLGTTAYWVDNLNPDRYINLSSVKNFLTNGKLNVDKLRIDKKHKLPTITPVSIEAGGQLEKGVYEVSLTYCDKLGNEIAEYISTTNPIHIYDNNNRVMDNAELSGKSNQAIKLRVENLDDQYKFYKVIVVQRLLDSTSYFIEGIHPINDSEIIVATVQDKQRTDINKLLATKTSYVRSEGITSSNGYLFRYGLTAEKEWNLQPISNLLGSFLRWQTVAAKEDLYSRGEASSRYKGYYRDEVYPFSIRFITNTGYKTALFPLVSRPATTFLGEEGVIDENAVVENVDTESVTELNPECSTENRNKYWQFYNTAHDVQRCTDYNVETVKVTQPIVKYCIKENVNQLKSGVVCIDLSDMNSFTTLANYIDEYGHNLSGRLPEVLPTGVTPANAILEKALSDLKAGINCTPYIKGNCGEPELEEESVHLGIVENESVTFIPKDSKEDYKRSKTASYGKLHKVDSEGKPVKYNYTKGDNIVEEVLTLELIAYERNANIDASKCTYSVKLNPIDGENERSQGYISNEHYLWGDIAEVITDTPSEENGDFGKTLSKGAMWFEADLRDNEFLIPEVTKWVESEEKRDRYADINNTRVRLSIYTGRCSNPKFVKSYIVDVREGDLLLDNPIRQSEVENGKFFIAIDYPVVLHGSLWYTPALPNGVFGLELRTVENESVAVSYDRITIDKRQKYVLDCEFEVPILDNCDPQPDKSGKFAYWESTEKYPSNKELYDSSELVIEEGDVPDNVKRDFEDYFVASKVNGKYLLKQDTNFANKPIRHFKFPDFNVAPFMSTNMLAPFTESIIYPLGVTLDKEVVEKFLDVAVKNGLITEEQRSTIDSFEIFRGDRRINKSIVGKGIAFDMYSYEEEETKDQILFPNFPFNDLGKNRLLYKDKNRSSFINHPYNGYKNNKFSFHSPEFDYYNLNVGTEAKLEAFQYGTSRGNFMDVEDHPEWVILGDKSYTVATTLATLEYLLEKAIRFTENAVQASQGLWFMVGVSSGSGAVGAGVGAGIAAAFEALEAVLYAAPQIGKYRYEWLKIFRDLGKPENFASQYSSEGFYNYAEPNNWLYSSTKSYRGNSLRAISTGKTLKEGRYIFTEKDGKSLKVNNLNREKSLLLTFGEKYNIDYPDNYRLFDNSDVDSYGSSRTIQSESSSCEKGKSQEIQKNIASPYVSLKNYVPFQYGSINSIKWLPVDRVQLDGDSACYASFGGDIYISRYTLKRKIPLFTSSAFGQADMIPFEYNKHRNIGYPRFYCDYELGSEKTLNDIIFPDFESDFNFDCQTSTSGAYVKSPSKMYLNFYGIPNFLVESEINLNLRYGKKEPKDNFYPEVGDFNDWTQEKNVSIREPNKLYYSNIYSSVASVTAYHTLPDYYNKEEFDVIKDAPSGVIYSMQDTSENDLTDPWLTYRPLDYYQFPSSYGGLVDLKGIESAQILGRFENTTVLFNAVNQYRDAQTAVTRETGTGGIFYTRPIEFSSTELGYRGSSTHHIISNETGHFYPDAERGQVFQYVGGNNLPIEISSTNGKSSTGMKAWFKEHLPFKVKSPLIENYEDIDTDNALNGIGITMGWDAKFDRVFLSKIDYAPIKEMSYHNGKFMVHDCSNIQYCQYPNKQQTIQDMLNQGYKFIEEDCKLVFQKYTDTCDYEVVSYSFPEDEKRALIEQGYTLVGQNGDTLHYEKVEDACDPNSKKLEIEKLISEGYEQDSVSGCTITFVKKVCSFDNQQTEIQDLLNQGYTLRDETECSKVFEKSMPIDYNMAVDDFIEVNQGESITFSVIANDHTPITQPLAIREYSQPRFGSLLQVNSTSFKYTHHGSEDFADSFTYKAYNDHGTTGTATVHIHIRGKIDGATR